MFRIVFRIILIIYILLSSYFAWQYLTNPELNACWNIPTKKLFESDLPQTWTMIDQSKNDIKANEITTSIGNKLSETATQAQKISYLSEIIAKEIGLDDNTPGTTDTTKQELEPAWNQKITDFGKYLYCKNHVEEYEKNHNQIKDIIPDLKSF